MKIKMLVSVAAITAGVGVGAAFNALAQQKPEDVIKYRKALMTVQSWHMRPMAAMVKGAQPYDKDVFAYNAQVILDTAKSVHSGFGPGTDKGAETKAKSEIWSEPDKFKQAADSLVAEANKLVEASKAGTLDAVRTQFGAMAKNCGGCHDGFRAK